MVIMTIIRILFSYSVYCLLRRIHFYVTLPPGVSPIAVINIYIYIYISNNSVALVRKRTNRPSDRRFSAKLVASFCG
jgi:hypothetical protein